MEKSTQDKKPFLYREVPPAVSRALALVLLLALFCSLFSCSLLQALPPAGGSRANSSAKSVLQYTGEELPAFDREKFRQVERLVDLRSVYDYSDKESLAEAMMSCYRETFAEKIDTADPSAVTDALLVSFITALGDPYAYYRTAEEYEEYNTDMSGQFFGIGVTVRYNAQEETVRVVEVFEDSPAEAAGILVGDYLIGVDGESLQDLGYENMIRRIRGEKDTAVQILLRRGDEEFIVSPVRGPVLEKNVSYEIKDRIGYIRISAFKEVTAGQFAEAFAACKAAGVSGVIFDLRNNPGGYLDSVVEIISYLIPDGVQVVSFGDYAAPLLSDDKTEGDETLDVPCVVLCNEQTASAGELFTSAVRDFATEEFSYLSATVVGATTFGKGIMQTTYTFADRSALTLTVAFYNPPSGVNYHGIGIVPDVQIEDDPETEADEQLDRAYEILAALSVSAA